ncbi:MAG: AraC family transcriptional regulator [Pseudomonadota bacterium]
MTDLIVNIVDRMRVQSTAYLTKNLSAPWGVDVDAAPYDRLARFHYVVAGQTWVSLPNGRDPQLLQRGDIAIIPDGLPHSYFDAPGQTDPYPVKNYPTTEEPPVFAPFDPEGPDTHFLCGYFEISPETPSIIRDRMPALMIGRNKTADATKRTDLLVDLAAQELANPSTGFQVRLNRLTEMLCVQTLQDWLETALREDEYLKAMADPRTLSTLDAIHDDPYRDWTVCDLAAIYGQSRTAFSSRFKSATGCSPMQYVRSVRLKRACELLRTSQLSIDEIAFTSGYADTNAFNRAFKRAIGKSPGAFRRSNAQEAPMSLPE